MLDPHVSFFFDQDPMKERLVAQPPVRVISTLIDADDVGEQPERIIDLRLTEQAPLLSSRLPLVFCFLLGVIGCVSD